MDAALEEGATAGEIGVVPPIFGFLLLERVDVNEQRSTHDVLCKQSPQNDSKRLVVVVLSNQQTKAFSSRQRGGTVEIRQAKEGRFLNDYVFSRVE